MPHTSAGSPFNVTGYCEGALFKNNFAKMFSPCNYYAGIQLVMLCFSGVYEVSQHYKNWYGCTIHGRRDIAGIQFKFHHKLFKVVCICKTCLSSILTTQILPRDWWELFWIIVLVVKKIRKVSRSYLQNLSLACLKRSILENVTDIAKSSRQSLEKVLEITLLPRLEWNLAWKDLNCAR